MWDSVYPYLAALLPTIGIMFLFYVVMKNVMEADRNERKAQAKWDADRAAMQGRSGARPEGAALEREQPRGGAERSGPDQRQQT